MLGASDALPLFSSRSLTPLVYGAQVVAWIKRILRVEKTGHSGTLDPKVRSCVSLSSGFRACERFLYRFPARGVGADT